MTASARVHNDYNLQYARHRNTVIICGVPRTHGMESKIMHLDARNFDAVWQHICARATVDLEQGTQIASFVREDGHWIQAVQPERIRVTSRIPRGKGARSLAKSLFHLEWKKLTSLGASSYIADQVIWDLLACYFEDVGRRTRAPLRWTSFTRERPSR